MSHELVVSSVVLKRHQAEHYKDPGQGALFPPSAMGYGPPSTSTSPGPLTAMVSEGMHVVDVSMIRFMYSPRSLLELETLWITVDLVGNMNAGHEPTRSRSGS